MSAKRKCKYAIKQIGVFCDKFNNTPKEEFTRSLLEVKLTELERRWLNMVELVEEFIANDEKVKEEEDLQEEIATKCEEASEQCQAIKAKILEMIKPTEDNTNNKAPNQTPLKLPAIEIQIFEGGYNEWPAFRDMFMAVVGNEPSVAPAHKLYYLHSKTRGEAYQLIKDYELVDSNFELAWQALKSRYENKRVLINNQIRKIYAIQTPQTETLRFLRLLKNTVSDGLSIMKSFDVEISSNDPFLMHICAAKLPEETSRAWESSLSNHKELPTWQQLSDFLSERIETLETFTNLRKPTGKDVNTSKSQSFHSQDKPVSNNFNCKKCKQNHPLRFCRYFKSLAVSDRIKFVYANKYCANCLSNSHFKSKCTSSSSCSRCNQKHHTLLHIDQMEGGKSVSFPATSAKSITQENDKPSGSGIQNNSVFYPSKPTSVNFAEQTQTYFSQHRGTTILPTALVHVGHLGENFTIRVLLDAGSESSFISKRLQQNLALPMEAHAYQVSGLGGTVVGNYKGICSVAVKSRISDFTICVQAIVAPRLTHFLPSRPVRVYNLSQIQGLNLADPSFFKPGAIDMIIGSDYLPFINLPGVKFDIGNTLEARESHFGWYLSGPEPVNDVRTFHTTISPSEDVILHEQLTKFWEIEEVEHIQVQTQADIFCENFFQRTTTRQEDGRFVVRLPFKENFPDEIYLGPSKNTALAQYYRMEKTLEKTPALKTQYTEVLQEYLHLDHMEQVASFEPKYQKISSFFLPHHAVIKPESKSTKVRVVFNASKKSGSGLSLNDVLYQGPALQSDLMQIVLRWRNYKYVFTGDIQKMYRQILIHEKDRPYQRILFRTKVDGYVDTFQLKTVTFGVNCAPFLAIRSLLELSNDCKELYPMASTILKKEVYVDDILSGGHSIAEVQSKRNELLKALESAGFPLKKLTANEKSLLENLPREDLLDEDFLKFDESSTIKTLGIRWNALSDTFYYVVQPNETSPSTTKRKILSLIARLYDPLGWLGPIVIVAKILMQELWQEKSEWDDEVSPLILTKWNLFVNNLPLIENIKIPRWVHVSPKHLMQLHGFCDASERAYCASVYIRTENAEGKITCHLLTAKTKVAPIKRTTIPKLELCGALLLAKLMQNIVTNYDFPHKIFLWTDSSIVLGWLQKSPIVLKTFVANRVSQINHIAAVHNWKHIKTDENPADLGSRGCSPQELIGNQLWWNGPPWLKYTEEYWPAPRTFDPTDLETKHTTNLHLNIRDDDVLERFSSFEKALRVLCYIFRFINRIQKKPYSSEKFITSEEIILMKTKLIFIEQKTFFAQEYTALKNKKSISRKSRILTLNPFIDSNGLLRVGGRLNNAGLSYEERHPIIIPGESRFAKLLVDFTHRILLHSEHQIMLRAIRQGFYIRRLKNLIRKCIRECKICTIYKQKMQHQIMAALPTERVNFSLPFTYTGVDFAGPFRIKSSNLRNAKILKSYAAVFVCFATRAVHLESCTDLTTDAFLACFDRFVGRRGLPKTMFSDNGRNFLGASYALLKSHNEFIKSAEKSLIEKYATLGFTWSFIPPHAPHMGGLWEAAVKSMKSHLKKIAANLTFTYEEFSTLLIRIEAVLNSRPLSSLTENPQEVLPITPGHFLRGAPLTSLPEAPAEAPLERLSYMKRWERLKALQHIFARRWKSEYITELQRRYKWQKERDNLKPDDIVIIKEDFLPPTEWLLGRVTSVVHGADGRIRVAEIKTKNGIILRPVTTGKPKCHICSLNHPLKYCRKFKELSLPLRRLSLINKGHCLNCLAFDHIRTWCPSRERCQFEYGPNKFCNARHHSILHREERDPLSSSFEDDLEPPLLEEDFSKLEINDATYTVDEVTSDSSSEDEARRNSERHLLPEDIRKNYKPELGGSIEIKGAYRFFPNDPTNPWKK